MGCNPDSRLPLCVDLDGTLVLSDTLFESLFRMLRIRPLAAFLVPLWLLKGRSFLKSKIAGRSDLDPASLPYNNRFLSFLRAEKERGRPIWLVTAAHTSIARSVAGHTRVFSEVIASDEARNLKGAAKRDELVRRLGDRGFDYAGNDCADVPVWSAARRAIVVNASPRTLREAQSVCEVERSFERRPIRTRDLIKFLRVHQWAKNGLLFVPILTSHQLDNLGLLIDSVIAFAAFSLCASSVYIINDLLDLPSDRKHQSKKRRALASGLITIPWALLVATVALALGFTVAACVNTAFFAVLALYFLTTLAYSIYLKSIALLDVMLLAGLYVVRVIGGAAAITVDPTFWLLAFSMFLFLSLALVKRSAELIVLRKQQTERTMGRGYGVLDLEYLHGMGTASGYLAVLVMALYINSPDVLVMYSSPELLWLLCPIMLYWISYIWLRTGRGEMNEDPVLFAIRDPLSIVIFGIAGLILAAAVLLD